MTDEDPKATRAREKSEEFARHYGRSIDYLDKMVVGTPYTREEYARIRDELCSVAKAANIIVDTDPGRLREQLFPTGLSALDDALAHGFKSGELAVFGRTRVGGFGGGRTMLAQRRMMQHLSRGGRVWSTSLEMPDPHGYSTGKSRMSFIRGDSVRAARWSDAAKVSWSALSCLDVAPEPEPEFTHPYRLVAASVVQDTQPRGVWGIDYNRTPNSGGTLVLNVPKNRPPQGSVDLLTTPGTGKTRLLVDFARAHDTKHNRRGWP